MTERFTPRMMPRMTRFHSIVVVLMTEHNTHRFRDAQEANADSYSIAMKLTFFFCPFVNRCVPSGVAHFLNVSETGTPKNDIVSNNVMQINAYTP